MRVVVLGAGVIGLATAYYLVRDGHDVTVVDRNDGVALETSFANGAQLSYSYVAPLAGPGVLPKIPPWLLRRDSPLRFYPKLDPAPVALAARVRARVQRDAERPDDAPAARAVVLQPAADDRAAGAARQIEFGHARNGKLVVHSDAAGFASARRLVDYQRSLGCEQAALSRDDCFALEPSLALDSVAPVGARLAAASTRAARRSAIATGSASASSTGWSTLGVTFAPGDRNTGAIVAERRPHHACRDAMRRHRGGCVRSRAGRADALVDAAARLRLAGVSAQGLQPDAAGEGRGAVCQRYRLQAQSGLCTVATVRRDRNCALLGWPTSRAIRPVPIRCAWRQLVAEVRRSFPRATDYGAVASPTCSRGAGCVRRRRRARRSWARTPSANLYRQLRAGRARLDARARLRKSRYRHDCRQEARDSVRRFLDAGLRHRVGTV